MPVRARSCTTAAKRPPTLPAGSRSAAKAAGPESVLLSAGKLIVGSGSGGGTIIGNGAGSGAFIQTGGTGVFSGGLTVASLFAGAGSFTLSGGTDTISGDTVIADAGVGAYRQSGARRRLPANAPHRQLFTASCGHICAQRRQRRRQGRDRRRGWRDDERRIRFQRRRWQRHACGRERERSEFQDRPGRHGRIERRRRHAQRRQRRRRHGERRLRSRQCLRGRRGLLDDHAVRRQLRVRQQPGRRRRHVGRLRWRLLVGRQDVGAERLRFGGHESAGDFLLVEFT